MNRFSTSRKSTLTIVILINVSRRIATSLTCCVREIALAQDSYSAHREVDESNNHQDRTPLCAPFLRLHEKARRALNRPDCLCATFIVSANPATSCSLQRDHPLCSERR